METTPNRLPQSPTINRGINSASSMPPLYGATSSLPRGPAAAATAASNRAAALATAAALNGYTGEEDYGNEDFEKDSENGDRRNNSAPASRRGSLHFVQTGAFASSTSSTPANTLKESKSPQPQPQQSANNPLNANSSRAASAAIAPTRAGSPNFTNASTERAGVTFSSETHETSALKSSSSLKQGSQNGGAAAAREALSSPTSTNAAGSDNNNTNNPSPLNNVDVMTSNNGAGFNTMMSIEDELRNTPEYKMAWDMELWRMVQRQRIEKEVKEYRKKLHDDAKASLLSQEREIKKELERAISDLAAKEKLFEEEERKQDKRKMRLLDAEREMERKASALVEHRKRLDDEAEQKIRRYKAEFDHKEELSLQRLQTLQDSLKRTEQRLDAGQKEYLKLWEEFAEFRTKTITAVPTEGVAMERLRVQHANEMLLMQERIERQARDQMNELNRRLDVVMAEHQKSHTALAHKKEQLRNVTRERDVLLSRVEGLEAHVQRLLDQIRMQQHNNNNTNGKLIMTPQAAAAGHSVAAAADPEAVALREHIQRTIQNETAGMRKAGAGGVGNALLRVADNNAGGNLLLSTTTGGSGGSVACGSTQAILYEQLNRWCAERQKLLELSGGAYDERSPVVAALDVNIRRAKERIKAIERAD